MNNDLLLLLMFTTSISFGVIITRKSYRWFELHYQHIQPYQRKTIAELVGTVGVLCALICWILLMLYLK